MGIQYNGRISTPVKLYDDIEYSPLLQCFFSHTDRSFSSYHQHIYHPEHYTRNPAKEIRRNPARQQQRIRFRCANSQRGVQTGRALTNQRVILRGAAFKAGRFRSLTERHFIGCFPWTELMWRYFALWCKRWAERFRGFQSERLDVMSD